MIMPMILKKGLAMAESNLPQMEENIVKFFAEIKLEQGEVRAMVTAFPNKSGEIVVAMTTFNDQNKAVRIIWKYTLNEMLAFIKLIDPKDLESLGEVFKQLKSNNNDGSL